MNEQITLITVNSAGNSFNRVTEKVKRTVFCTEDSISQREFFEATAQGLKAEIKVKLWTQDYNGEKIVEYGTDETGKPKEYKVYRTFKRFDITELYLASEG